MEIEITHLAEIEIISIEEYIENRWNAIVLADFRDKFDAIIENIISGRVVYQDFQKTEFQKALITKHNTLVFHKKDTKITIIRILQNFQVPEENLKNISK
ncbi:hypothetical protein [Kaistella sp.]|uniref:hypothetical protein n=1 Tax=Kaistella sp. TaxID=2782235 RepID=UPI003C4ECF66